MHIQCLISLCCSLPHSKQNRYRCKLSVSMQLLAYLDGIYRGLEVSENSYCSLYLDFSKAFDKINHQLLLQKLKALGVTGKPLGLPSPTSLTGSNTSRLALAARVRGGVPQGSILGPLLFLSYCLNLTHGTKSSVFPFADDTKLLSTTPAGNESSLPDDSTTLFIWSEKNGLPFNIGKCKLLRFQKPNLPCITLGDLEL